MPLPYYLGWSSPYGNRNNNQKWSPLSGSTSWMVNTPQNAMAMWNMARSLDPTGGKLSNSLGRAFMADALEKQGYYSGGSAGQCPCCGTGSNPYGNMNTDYMNQIIMAAYLMAMAETMGEMGDTSSTAEEELARRLGINDNNVGTVKKGMEAFSNIDINNDDCVTWDEYLDYYIAQREEELGTDLNPNSPKYNYLKTEAENLFNAIAADGKIPKDRFKNSLDFFDKRDGKKDGKIKGNFMSRAIAKIKNEGPDAKISNGKTLKQFLDQMV